MISNKYFEVKLEKRKQCPACRYEECLRIGMRPTLVLSDDEKHIWFKNLKRKDEDPPEHDKRNSIYNKNYR